MKKYLIPIIFLSLLVFSSPAIAETKTFIKEYTYQASEYDSKVSCRALALEQVKRLLLEKQGTYLESETEVKNFQLTKDQIVILSAGVVRAEIVNEKWDGKTYYLKAKIAADPKEVIKSIDRLRQDRQKTKELEETRKKAEEALEEVERLKKELEIRKPEKPNLGQYAEAVKRLTATDWFEKGYVLAIAGRDKEAVEANTRAIELDPKLVEAYYNRGLAYAKLGDNPQAIRDYDKAIELDSKLVEAYVNRGGAYWMLGNSKQALEDYKIAASLGHKQSQDFLRSQGAENAKIPGEQREENKQIASLPQVPPTAITSESEVRQFLDSYVKRYNLKELEGIISSFSAKAIQNQKDDLGRIRKSYETFFEQMETVQYQITIDTIQPQQNSIEVRGQYQLEGIVLKGRKKENWKGQVRWVLVREDGVLRILTLDYQPQSSK